MTTKRKTTDEPVPVATEESADESTVSDPPQGYSITRDDEPEVASFEQGCGGWELEAGQPGTAKRAGGWVLKSSLPPPPLPDADESTQDG